MTTELQAAAVELQQIEAKRAELLPDDVREAMFDLQHDWELRPSRAASYDTIHAHIAAQSSEIERLRRSLQNFVDVCETAVPIDLIRKISEACVDAKETLAQGAKK